ncbi:MAG TPA: tRNA-uridine aminocarboxypropyltransferase [Verrucomicrobiae bacterium]|nr:tRNA-uridine aminocarboxypropyltransferase [Verrucomicrobiae bacterium]
MDYNSYMARRRLQESCPICYMNRIFCICDAIPMLTLKTRVCLVVHTNELKKSSNTGRLALRALTNSEMRVRGELGETLDLSDLLSERYRTFLFYPSKDAVELSGDLLRQDARPIQLIVPDGSWRQAGKMLYRHPELKDVPRVKLDAANAPKYYLRAQHRPEGMATLQAIAHALGAIEGTAVETALMKLYDAKIERTLTAKGILHPSALAKRPTAV